MLGRGWKVAREDLTGRVTSRKARRSLKTAGRPVWVQQREQEV